MNAFNETPFSTRVQDHYVDPFHRGECEQATHAAEMEHLDQDSSSVAGAVRFELQIVTDQMLASAWFEAAGSEFLQATASMVAEFAEGKSANELATMELEDLLGALNCPSATGVERDELSLVLTVLQAAIASPIDEEDVATRHTFLGPDFGEES